MKFLLPLLFILILPSCSQKPTVAEFEWMLGEWTKEDEATAHTTEVWEKINDRKMTGYGLTAIDGDTIFYEKLAIESKDASIYYLADVGNGTVAFELTTKGENRWVFENPDHDFPKRIIYVRDGEKMAAYTEAENVSIQFSFIKSK